MAEKQTFKNINLIQRTIALKYKREKNMSYNKDNFCRVLKKNKLKKIME